jgi:hypothetical protein
MIRIYESGTGFRPAGFCFCTVLEVAIISGMLGLQCHSLWYLEKERWAVGQGFLGVLRQGQASHWFETRDGLHSLCRAEEVAARDHAICSHAYCTAKVCIKLDF